MNWQDLPNHSKVWVYQADRFLTESEAVEIKQASEDFVMNWSSHGTNLKAASEIFYHLFVVFFVDQSDETASGCSIDKSVYFIKGLGEKYAVDFFKRTKICIEQNGKLSLIDMNELKERKVQVEDSFYNNLISNKEELLRAWKTSIKSSWLLNYLS